MDTNLQTLLLKVHDLLSVVSPVGFGRGISEHAPELAATCQKLRTLVPRMDARLVPTDKALVQWQQLSTREFDKQRNEFKQSLKRLEESLIQSPFPPAIDKIMSKPELSQVRDNLSQAYRSMIMHDSKSAVVMAGSALEALFQVKIASDTTRFKQSFQQLWPSRKVPTSAHEYRPADAISVIVEDGCLPSAIGKYAEGLQQSRNIIHPAVETKENLSPTQLDAELAVKTVLLMLEKLWN